MKNEIVPGIKNSMLQGGFSRRNFFSIAGLGLVTATIVSSCRKDKDPDVLPDGTIDLGSGDIGILNYAYALEQLEAAFYTQVADNFYDGASTMEKNMFKDIKYHEIAHREFFKAALGEKAIPGLEVNFNGIDFSSREQVLGTAKAFEDLGVSAYNGAGQLLENGEYLLLAGKIVSVEARHAAYIRDLINMGSFADNSVVDMNGLDTSREPAEVLSIAGQFLKSKVSGKNLPTS